MKYKGIVSAALAIALFMLTGIPTLAGGYTACVVNNPNPADRLHLRSVPRTDAASLGKYYNGTPVTVLADDNSGWVKVRIGEDAGGAEGYIQKRYLAVGDDCASVKPAFPLYQATSSGWDLYSFPRVYDNAGRTFGVENIEVLGVAENWWHVRIREHTGYLRADALAIVSNPNPDDRLSLHEKPQTGAAALGEYYNGTIVRLVSIYQNGWVSVEIGSLEGCMESRYLSMNPWNETVVVVIPTVKVETPGGGVILRENRVRKPNSLGLGTYDNGTLVQVLGVSETWCHVLVDGKAGFMMTEYLNPKRPYNAQANIGCG